MPTFYRVLLGRGSSFAGECIAGNYIGVNFRLDIDFTGTFGDSWREFNKRTIPEYQKRFVGSSRIAAGIACGAIYVIGRQMQNGDYVISPMGDETYRIGQINGDYAYVPNTNLPHRRGVQWISTTYQKHQLSADLIKSIHSQMTVINLSASDYDDELHRLIGQPVVSTTDEVDSYEFALEKHLEDFLIKNWTTLPIGKDYDIFRDEERIGQQYPTETGPIDILAISKDQKRLLVIELKKGRTSDVAVGQVLRYMGFVKANLLEANQEVHGMIIAYHDDLSIRLALSMVPNVTFLRYQVNFVLG